MQQPILLFPVTDFHSQQGIYFNLSFQTCNCVSFSPVPAAFPTKSVTNEGQTVATVHPQPQPADEAVIHPSHCAAGYSDGTIRIFDLGKVEMIMKMQPHAASVTAISFSAHGKNMCEAWQGLTIQLLSKDWSYLENYCRSNKS